ncbi:MAG: hypothetical protein ABI548_10225 [Polyangiaceae bacterium]
MPSKTVEFRYLQVITNHLSGDRVTVALAHWDGSALRFACAVASLRDHPGFVDIERAVRAIERSITQRSEELRSASSGVLFSPTLAELAPGSELIGDALVWSEVRRGITGDSAAHFTELGSKLGLLPVPHDVQRFSRATIRSALENLARDFEAYPDLVKTSVELRDHYRFIAPVSWKNGVWNHAVPLNLDVDTQLELEAQIRATLARVITAIPRTENPVLIAALPQKPNPAVRDVEKEARYAQEAIGSRARLAHIRAVGGRIDTSEVRTMIDADIAGHVVQTALVTRQ